MIALLTACFVHTGRTYVRVSKFGVQSENLAFNCQDIQQTFWIEKIFMLSHWFRSLSSTESGQRTILCESIDCWILSLSCFYVLSQNFIAWISAASSSRWLSERRRRLKFRLRISWNSLWSGKLSILLPLKWSEISTY